MKLKEKEINEEVTQEQEVTEKEGMNKELYDLFIKMIRFEYNKGSFLKGAKFYCWAHGLDDYYKFFKNMIPRCRKCKDDFVFYLFSRFEEIPEIKIEPIKTEFKSAEEVFTAFVEREEEFINILEKIILKAKELNDVSVIAFTLPILNKVDHIACRALEAVKADKNPNALINPWIGVVDK